MIVAWTPPEPWVFAEAACQALVARLDGGAPQRAWPYDERARFRGELHGGDDEITIELTVDADHAVLALDPPSDARHRWREAWVLEVERPGDPPWSLRPGAPPVTIDDARRAPLIARLRRQRRAIVRALDGEDVEVPLAEVAFHKYTRQSTRAPRPEGPDPWMVATEVEAAPWWELDLGRGMYLASLRAELVAPAPGTRVVVTVYGFATPAQAPPARAFRREVEVGDAAGRLEIALDPGIVARVVRIALVAPGGAALTVTALELTAAELHTGTLAESTRRSYALFRDRPLFVARAIDEGTESGGVGTPGAMPLGRGRSPRGIEDAPFLPQLTYGEVWSRGQALGRALASRLEDRGDRVFLGVVLRNRAEWVIAELAALARGYVLVPISPEDPDDRLAKILERARPACLICEADDAERLARLGAARLIVACGAGLDALIAEGARATVPAPAPRGDDEVWTVLFTSGSTGTPKGAMRSYATFRAMLASYAITQSTHHLSFQPLSHLSERMYLPALILHGATIAFSRGGAHLPGELRAFAPEVLGSVPRLFEVLHAGYRRRLRAALAAEPDTPRAVVEARELAEARRAFGDRLQGLSVGSAPVSPELGAFLRRCFADVWVTEGYGSTEVGTITVDGVVQSHVEIKLVPRADQAPPAPGEPERGEIWVRSPHLVLGYLGDPEASAAAQDGDGFFATGDLGERAVDGRGTVRVIGRVASTVKLANGEFVSAERIELALGGAPIVDRVFVLAEPGASAVAALVVPEPGALARLLERDGALAELAADPRAAGLILAALRAQARRAGLAAHEVPRGVHVLGVPLSVDDGLLTTSGKLARGALARRFGAELAVLARGGDDTTLIDEPVDDDLRARVLRAAARVLGRAVDAHEPLAGGVDSLAAAEILATLSEDLGRDVPLSVWFAARDLAALAASLDEDAVAAGAGSDALVAEDRAWVVAVDAAVAPPRPVRELLLTGATGFLGAHLLEALVARPELRVTCLVRAVDDGAAAARVAAALARLGIAEAPADRVRVITGDLAAPGLGLTAERRAELADGVDAILHAGATVSWLAPYAELRAGNVGGTVELLALAGAGRKKPFHFVSTISTAPADGDETSFLAVDVVARGTPYGLSKWIAEEQVRRARHLPVAIYRPAMIAGHSTRGHGNPDDFLHRYLAGVLELGRYVDLEDARCDFTPVDYVASAIVALVVARPLGGETYHLANVDQSPSYAALGRALAAAGAAVTPASYSEFRAALLRSRGRLHALASFFPGAGFAMGMGPWPCARTVADVAALGITRPRVDDALIARYYTAVRDRLGS